MSVDNDYSYPEAGYFYVNMPTTSTASVNIPEGLTSFKVYDDGGKSGKYSLNCNGYLTLVTPTTCTLQLTGTVNIRRSSYQVENGANPRFWIYDGNASAGTLKKVWSGSSDVSENIGTINSTGNTVTLYLYNSMTSSESLRNGVDITVTVISPDTEYDVSIANGIEHGSITTAKNKAGADETITLTATPESGYLLNGISVTDRYSNTVPVSFTPWYKGATGATTATFTMPKSNATVTATFTKIDNTNNAFSINLPKTGTETGTIPSGVVSFKVYDDGGASGNYSPNCNGSITLTAPEGYGFQIEGSTTTYSGAGSLTVSNSKGTILNGVHGSDTQKDAVYTVNPVASADQTLTITFEADEHGTTNAGVDLTVSVIDLTRDFSITVNAAEHGTVTPSKTTAKAGDVITLTPSPDSGYMIKSVAVTDSESKNVSVSGAWWTENFSFTMPYGSVTVTPVAEAANADGGLVIDGLTYVGKSGDNPGYYKIDSPTALNTLASYVNGGGRNEGMLFKQTADIDMSGQGYTPIGKDDTNTFNGIYDGDGYVILNISHNDNSSGGKSGMFGKITNGTVKNINLKNCSFSGDRAGGIACDMNQGTIDNCTVIGGTVSTGVNGYAGGILGSFYAGTVKDCFTTATVSAFSPQTGMNGPIVGTNNGTTADSYYTVAVSGGNSRGTKISGGFITVGNGATIGSGVFRTIGKTEANTYYFDKQGEVITFSAEVPTTGMKKFTATAGTLAGTSTAGTVSLSMPASDVSVSLEDVSLTISDIEAQTYTGSAIEPTVTVKDGETTLTLDSEYTVDYTNNTNAGEANVSITGKGMYLGTATKTFTISPASVTLTANSRNTDTYDGTEKTVTGYTSSVDGLTFAESVSASGSGTNAGEHDVTFSGVTLNETKDNTGNYVITATTNGKLTINPASVTLTANSETKAYNGAEQTLEGFTCSVDNLTFTGVSASGSGTNTGSYDVTFTGVTLNETKDNTGNYVVTNTTNGTLTIVAAETNYGAAKIIWNESGTTVEFNGASEEEVSITSDIEVDAVTYIRTFTADKASTVMLPFDYTCNGNEGGKFYEFVGVTYDNENSKWVATMQEPGNTSVTSLTANTPYLFMPNGTTMTFPNISNMEGGKVTLNTTKAGGSGVGSSASGEWQFYGTYAKKVWDAASNDYGFAATSGIEAGGTAAIEAGQFVRFTTNAFIKPMRCYLSYIGTSALAPARGLTRSAAEELPQSITVRLLSRSGETTGIGTLDTQTGEFDFDGWYDMNGCKLSGKPTKKGLYINNGKKIVIK